MLNDEFLYVAPDAREDLGWNYVIECKSIKLKTDKIEIELKDPDYESLRLNAKTIVINGCEYVLKKRKEKK